MSVGGALAVPTASARAAALAARHLTEHCPHTQATWQVDQGMGRPCRGCHQRRATPHDQHTALPVRSPGEHLHPQLRRPLLAGHSREGGSST